MAADASTLVVPAGPRAPTGRRFRLVAAITVSVVLAYGAATAVGASGGALDLAFTAAIVTLPPFAWWAFARAPGELRSLFFLLGLAATFWLAGSLIWYGYFLSRGQKVPTPPGPWDAAFLLAYALALGAVFVGFRTVISLRRVALDASVLGAAALAFGAALIGHGLAHGVSAASLVPILRPLLGIVMIALIASAALGRWEGLPVSVALVGAGQVFLTVGSFVYAFQAVNSNYVNDRWANLGWFAGAALSLLAAGAVVLGVNGPVRLGTKPSAIPNEPVGAKGVLYLALGGLAVTLGVALDGKLTGNGAVLIVGLLCGAWVGLAMAVRARSSIRELERAYERLDRAQLELERTKDRLGEANDELARANVGLRAVHHSFESLLVLVDEQTHGGLRELIEQAGEEFARLLKRYLSREP